MLFWSPTVYQARRAHHQVTDEAVKLFPTAAGPESNLAVMAVHNGDV
jgi:hypothetical protein